MFLRRDARDSDFALPLFLADYSIGGLEDTLAFHCREGTSSR
jgi:hypothetical protein